MSGQHTPGALGTDCHEHDEPYQNISLVIGTRTVATVCIDDAPVHDFNAEQQANARRLVACWNACDGVPTDALEQIEGFGKAALPYHLLKAQRNELLAALKSLKDRCQEAKKALDEEIETGRPVHPVSASLTWPTSVAITAIANAEKGGVL